MKRSPGDLAKLKAFRRRKARFLASLPSRTSDELEDMLFNHETYEKLDLDDDDERAIWKELGRRGIHLFEGEDVPYEELLEGCPDCEELRKTMEQRARRGELVH